MPPQATPPTPTPTPSPEPATPVPATPPAPITPPVQPPLPPAPVQATPPPNFTSANSASKKSKKPLLFGVVGLVVVLIILAALAWFFIFSPQAQSAKTANAFIKDITTGNTDAATKLSSEPTSEDTKSFIQTSATATKGTAKLSKTTFKDGKRYSLYTLSGGDKKFARVTVEKEDGKWVVSSYVYGNSELALIPSTSTSSNSSEAAADTPTPASNTACLVLNDFYDMATFLGGGTPANLTDSHYNDGKDESYDYTTFDYFMPDSLTIDPGHDVGDFTTETRQTAIADFYKAHPNQLYTIHLEGVVATTAKADLSFATQRAEKVKASYVAKGVPASKIVIDAPQNIDTFQNGTWKGSTDSVSKELNRSVATSIRIDASCRTAD